MYIYNLILCTYIHLIISMYMYIYMYIILYVFWYFVYYFRYGYFDQNVILPKNVKRIFYILFVYEWCENTILQVLCLVYWKYIFVVYTFDKFFLLINKFCRYTRDRTKVKWITFFFLIKNSKIKKKIVYTLVAVDKNEPSGLFNHYFI